MSYLTAWQEGATLSAHDVVWGISAQLQSRGNAELQGVELAYETVSDHPIVDLLPDGATGGNGKQFGHAGMVPHTHMPWLVARRSGLGPQMIFYSRKAAKAQRKNQNYRHREHRAHRGNNIGVVPVRFGRAPQPNPA